MTNPLHARCYADQAAHRTVPVEVNEQIARDTWRLRLTCPEIARRFLPGQFVMLRLPGSDDPLLGRPLAVYDGTRETIDLVYLTVGKMTNRLVEVAAGEKLEIWGPLGNGFPPEPTEHLVMVAGGIGQTPFLTLGREYLGVQAFGDPPRSVATASQVTLCYGARSAEYLAGVDDFVAAGIEVRLSTDDGSRGHHGLVTDLLSQTLADAATTCRVVCCGPEPMMQRVSQIATAAGVACQVSLETPMSCGIGICFTCVARVRDEQGEWDFKRTCVEGPVFDAAKIVW